MTAKKLNFEVDKFQLLSDSQDEQLSILKLWVVSPGQNLHNLPISWQSILDAKESLVGKPILAAYDHVFDKLKGHEPDENAIGVVLKPEDIFEEKDENGKQWLCARAFLWNKYYPREVEVLRKNDGKASVSMEIQVLDGTDNGDGFEDISLFSFMGVTILGTGIQPAIPGARLDVLKFTSLVKETEEIILNTKFSTRYESIDFTIPDVVKKNSQKGLSLYDKHKKGGNGYNLSVARFMVKNDKMEPSKVKKIFKSLENKSKKNLEKNSDNHIAFMLLGGKECMSFCGEIMSYMDDADKNQPSHFTFNADDKGIETEENLKKKTINMESPEEEKPVEEKMAEEKPVEEKMAEEVPAEKEETEEKMSETPEEEKAEPVDEEAKETPEEESKEGEEDVSMSLDMYADVSALMSLLGQETEEYKKMSEEFSKPEKDFAKISEGLYALCKKYAEKCMSIEEAKKAQEEKMQSLEKFKADAEEKEFKLKVYSILEEIKPFVTESDLTSMRENSSKFSIETIGVWEKEVKSSLFTILSQKVNEEKHDGIVKMQLPFNNVSNTNDKKYIW